MGDLLVGKMVKNTFLAAILLASTSTTAVEYDKKLHFVGSVIIGSVTQVAVEDWRVSAATCMAIGIAKEVYDEYSYGGFDTKDLLFDAAGCALGVLTGNALLSVWHKEDTVGISYHWEF